MSQEILLILQTNGAHQPAHQSPLLNVWRLETSKRVHVSLQIVKPQNGALFTRGLYCLIRHIDLQRKKYSYFGNCIPGSLIINIRGRIQRGQGVWTPLKNHKNIGFLCNIGPDPRKKITKLQSQHSMLGHHLPASETPSSVRQRNAISMCEMCEKAFLSQFKCGSWSRAALNEGEADQLHVSNLAWW